MTKILTDRTLKALARKPAAPGKTYDVADGVVPGLAVRVMPSGVRSFILVARFPGSRNPTRRSLGAYGALTLQKAREKARTWLQMIERGVDPTAEEERQRETEQHRQQNSFAAVAEDFIAEKLPSERKGKEAERNIRREFLPMWGKRPITDVTELDVIGMVKAKGHTAPAQARNLLGIAKRLFKWARAQRCYGLSVSPADQVKPGDFLGDRVSGERILSDDELFALWRAAKRTPYPAGPVYRILVLTALRLNEVADASWREFDLPNRLWTIPAARMKGRNSKARPHAIPLIDDVLANLDALPRFKSGDYLFSTINGVKPAWMSDKIKKRIDVRMLRTLRAMARVRGDDPARVQLARWTNHDIRRTVRSGLSRLKVTEQAREAILAHRPPGIKGAYDLHDYMDEKRQALEQWAKRLRSIVDPPPTHLTDARANVVRFGR
jgi:integrase